MMVFIYVLKCQHNKYYVGKTMNPAFRIEEHFASSGSTWTKIYKPLELKQLIPNCDDYDEDKYTKIYMDMYGLANVRGGSYAKTVLSASTIEHLKHESKGTNDACFMCGEKGHFLHECTLKLTDMFNTSFMSPSRGRNNNNSYANNNNSNWNLAGNCNNFASATPIKCHRCGRYTHVEDECYASYHVNGSRLSIYSNDNNNRKCGGPCCYRCGRPGHLATHCTEGRHVDGGECSSLYRKIAVSVTKDRHVLHDIVESEPSSQLQCQKLILAESEDISTSCSSSIRGLKRKLVLDMDLEQTVKFTETNQRTKRGEDKRWGEGGTCCCERCGRIGHFATDCYVKTDITGSYINDAFSDWSQLTQSDPKPSLPSQSCTQQYLIAAPTPTPTPSLPSQSCTQQYLIATPTPTLTPSSVLLIPSVFTPSYHS